MSLVYNDAPFEHAPVLGEVVKVCEIGTIKMPDGSDKPYSEKYFVTIKELPSESNHYTYSGVVSNKLIYSKQQMGSVIQFKFENIIEITGRIHSMESTHFYIDLLQRNPQFLQLFQTITVKKK